jgi:hypothetical protein
MWVRLDSDASRCAHNPEFPRDRRCSSHLLDILASAKSKATETVAVATESMAAYVGLSAGEDGDGIPAGTQKYTRGGRRAPPGASHYPHMRQSRRPQNHPRRREFRLDYASMGIFSESAVCCWVLASQRRGRRFKSDHLHHENRRETLFLGGFCFSWALRSGVYSVCTLTLRHAE